LGLIFSFTSGGHGLDKKLGGKFFEKGGSMRISRSEQKENAQNTTQNQLNICAIYG